MQLLSDIVRDANENFGLGNRAAVLVLEASKSLFDTRHGGLTGLMNRLESEGLGGDLANWRNASQEIRFPDASWIDNVFGVEMVSRIGRDLGMANARVRTVLAYVIPYLIRYFASGQTLPDHLPSAVEDYLSAGKTDRLAPRSRGIKKTSHKRSRTARGHRGAGKLLWAGGVIALLISGYFLGQDVISRSRTVATQVVPTAAVTLPPSSIDNKATEPQASLPAIEAKGPGAKLVIRSYGSQIEYLGFVNSPEIRAQLIEKLQKSFGAPRLVGEIVVDSERAEPVWIGQLDRLLPLISVPGLDIRLEGSTVRVGGWIAEEDRTSVLNNLMSTLGASYKFGYLREEEIERNQDSRQFILAALAHASSDIKAQDLIFILNRWVIAFPEGSATFPDDAREVLNRVAEVMKSAKQHSIIEIQGHVDVGANANAAIKLSLDRANAVRDALIKAGISSGLLRVKGYGSDKRLATGGAAFDRARNERIEFRVIQVCDPYFPCDSIAPTKRSNAPDPNLNAPEASEPLTRTMEAPNPEGRSQGRAVNHPAESPATSLAPPAGASRGGVTEGSSPMDEAPTSRSEGSKLKALSEESPPPKPRPKVVSPPKPAAEKQPEWYDPLGLF